MITSTDIYRKALRHYYNWLVRIAEGNPDYPILRIERVGDKKNAPDRADNLADIAEASKNELGYGYRIELEPPLPNSKNKQSRFRAIVFDSGPDLLRFLGLESNFETFLAINERLKLIRDLDVWRTQNVREITRYAEQWPLLLRVVHYFKENPSPNLPLRLLPIEGIDTKFMEQYNTILCRLIDHVVPHNFINHNFRILAKRYGLPENEPLVECAWNDPALTQFFHGFTRLALPIDQLASHPLPVQRIIVVENKTSIQQLLQAPLPGTLLIFGGGFGVVFLKNCAWLHQLSLYYWGDIDTHGLSILSHFRSVFPKVNPLLMDDATLEYHASFCVGAATFSGQVPKYLTEPEKKLFQKLLAENLRLEQERVSVKWVQSKL